MAMEITAKPRRRGWLRALRVAAVVGLLVAVAALVPPALGLDVRVADGLVGDQARGALVFEDGFAADGVSGEALVIPYVGYPLLLLGALTVPAWAPAVVAIALAVMLLALRRRSLSEAVAPAVEIAADPVIPARSTPPAA